MISQVKVVFSEVDSLDVFSHANGEEAHSHSHSHSHSHDDKHTH